LEVQQIFEQISLQKVQLRGISFLFLNALYSVKHFIPSLKEKFGDRLYWMLWTEWINQSKLQKIL